MRAISQKYLIKKRLNDFIVKEVLNVDTKKVEKITKWKNRMGKRCKYVWMFVEKKNLDFFTMLKKISNKLSVPISDIGYCGIKDKHAVVKQYISVKNIDVDEALSLKFNGLKVISAFPSFRKLNSKDIDGNSFSVTVRNVDIGISELRKNIEKIDKTGFLNLFGEQRFGKRLMNVKIGKNILRRRFENALELMRDIRFLRHVSSIRHVPFIFLRFFISSYQSYVWNKCAPTAMKRGIKYLPIIGYKTELNDETGILIKKELKKDGIHTKHFFFPEMRGISFKGEKRKIVEHPIIYKWELKNSTLNIKFFLKRGSYATIFLKHLLIF